LPRAPTALSTALSADSTDNQALYLYTLFGALVVAEAAGRAVGGVLEVSVCVL
jgi:hypothetical protein